MKLKSFLLGLPSGLLLVIVLLNYFAFQYFLYWRWRWFDIPMHTLGGLFLGLFILWFYVFLVKRGRWEEINVHWFFILPLVLALLVGASWEMIEVGLDELGLERVTMKSLRLLQTGWQDTLGDLSSDALGALIAAFFYYFISLWQKRKLQ